MPGRSGWDHLNAGRTRLAELCFFGIWVLGTNKHTTPEYNPEYTNVLKDFGPISVVPKSKHRLCFCSRLVDILKHVIFLVMFGFHGHANQLYCIAVLFLDVDHAFVSFQQHTESSAPRLRLTKWCKMSGLRWVISSEAILQSLPLPPPRGILRAFSKGGQCSCHMVHLIKGPWTSGDHAAGWAQSQSVPWPWQKMVSLCVPCYLCFSVPFTRIVDFLLLNYIVCDYCNCVHRFHDWCPYRGIWNSLKRFEVISRVELCSSVLSCRSLMPRALGTYRFLIRAEFRLQSLRTNSKIQFFFDSALDTTWIFVDIESTAPTLELSSFVFADAPENGPGELYFFLHVGLGGVGVFSFILTCKCHWWWGIDLEHAIAAARDV